MDARVKQMWIEALQSGDFEQGKKRLQTNDGKYCCLGVLCELYRCETGKGKWEEGDSKGKKFLEKTGFLPPAVCEWAGLDCKKDDDIKIGHHYLSWFNDSGLNFQAIASLIQENL